VRKSLFILLAACCWTTLAIGGEAPPVAADPVLEARVNKLSEELRCLVCQNQSLADSHAELAQDLKNEVREMLRQGMSDKQAVDFLVQRYGDFVLYRPPVKALTWLLWGGPFVLLFAGLIALLVKLRRRPPSKPLSAAEHATAVSLLGNQGEQQ
jgi:cytochrome c-type biogenesis protein CcmH